MCSSDCLNFQIVEELSMMSLKTGVWSMFTNPMNFFTFDNAPDS